MLADAHADSLMWNRDLTCASERGQADFPRLRQAGVRIQCFTIVTRGYPFVGGFPLFAAWRGWPKKARRDEWSRALWQVDRLHEACARAPGMAQVAQSAQGLRDALASDRLSAILGVEGAHALGGDASRVAELWARGVRFMSLTHLSNNALGGSSFPLMGNRGLTAHGREVLDAMAEVGMSVDVAHASSRTLEEVLAHPGARPMCSHTGVRGAGGSWRNLSDGVLRRVADRGGVVGIIFATVYLGGRELSDVARHVEHAVSVMGEDGVALGSDFDGMVPLPRGMKDARDLPALAEVISARLPPRVAEKVLFGNWRRYFEETLDGRQTR
jgi:membrane dipeptidase